MKIIRFYETMCDGGGSTDYYEKYIIKCREVEELKKNIDLLEEKIDDLVGVINRLPEESYRDVIALKKELKNSAPRGVDTNESCKDYHVMDYNLLNSEQSPEWSVATGDDSSTDDGKTNGHLLSQRTYHRTI